MPAADRRKQPAHDSDGDQFDLTRAPMFLKGARMTHERGLLVTLRLENVLRHCRNQGFSSQLSPNSPSWGGVTVHCKSVEPCDDGGVFIACYCRHFRQFETSNYDVS